MDAPFEFDGLDSLPTPEPVPVASAFDAPALPDSLELRVSATMLPESLGALEVVDEVEAPVSSPTLQAAMAATGMPAALPALESTTGRMADDDAVAAMIAPFFHKGYVARKDAKGLMNPQHREEAERRLNAVGLTLAWSPYSRYYGLALADGPGGQKERITNMSELDRNALALLVILWARLVLPQRLAEEGREGGVSEPTVSFQALDAEFGKKLGGRRFEMYVGQLKRLGFLEYTRKDEIKAGPFLDLLGDSNRLATYLRQSTLVKVMHEAPPSDATDETDDEDGAEEAATVEV